MYILPLKLRRCRRFRHGHGRRQRLRESTAIKSCILHMGCPSILYCTCVSFFFLPIFVCLRCVCCFFFHVTSHVYSSLQDLEYLGFLHHRERLLLLRNTLAPAGQSLLGCTLCIRCLLYPMVNECANINSDLLIHTRTLVRLAFYTN